MSFRSRITDAWRALTRAGPAGYGMGVAWSGGPLYADAFGAKRGPSPWQLVESYKQIAFSCTEFNALGVAALDLHLYAASGRGREKPRSLSGPMPVGRDRLKQLVRLPYVRRSFTVRDVEDVHEITHHPFLDALENPAEDPETELRYFDLTTLVATLVRYLDIVGISYLKPENAAGAGFQDLVRAQSVPSHWWPLQSQYVWPIRSPNSALIKRFKYFLEDYEPGDLTFIRLRPSLRDPYGAGYAAAQAAWQYAGLEDKGISMWDQLLGTGARPNAVLSPSDPLTPLGEDERRRLDAEANTYHAQGRAGRLMVMSTPMRLDPIKYSGFDTGEMEVNGYNMERMCNCWGVPISFMTRETNLANFEAGLKFHAKFGITPRAQCIASALTNVVRQYDERLFIAFDEAVADDEMQKAKIIDMKVRNGQYSRNQANADEPWPPDPDGDEPFIAATLATPGMIREKHTQGLETARITAEAKANGGALNPAANGRPGAGGGGGKSSGDSGAKAQEERVLRRAARLLRKIEEELDS